MNIIPICGYCAKQDFPEVGIAVKNAGTSVNFTHGTCMRHFVAMLKQFGKTDEEIQLSLSRVQNKTTPDLKEHPDLVKLWSQGIFTKDQLQEQKKEDADFVERLKKLAGISH